MTKIRRYSVIFDLGAWDTTGVFIMVSFFSRDAFYIFFEWLLYVFISYRVNTEKKIADKLALLLDTYTKHDGKVIIKYKPLCIHTYICT